MRTGKTSSSAPKADYPQETAKPVTATSDPHDPVAPLVVLTTGGTIDKTYFDSLSQYQIGESVVQRLLEIARVSYPFRIVEALRKDSLDLTPDDREILRAKVAELTE